MAFDQISKHLLHMVNSYPYNLSVSNSSSILIFVWARKRQDVCPLLKLCFDLGASMGLSRLTYPATF